MNTKESKQPRQVIDYSAFVVFLLLLIFFVAIVPLIRALF